MHNEGSTAKHNSKITKLLRTEEYVPVPIEKIFEVEFEGSNAKKERQEKIRQKYEAQLKEIIKRTYRKLNIPNNILDKNLQDKRDIIKKIPEYRIFVEVARSFNEIEGIKIGIPTNNLQLYTAVEENVYSCYPGSVLLSDALYRMGKEVTAVIAKGHMFLASQRYAFETNYEPTSSFILRDSGYIERWFEHPIEISLDKTLIATLLNKGGEMVSKNNDYASAVIAFDNARSFYSKSPFIISFN